LTNIDIEQEDRMRSERLRLSIATAAACLLALSLSGFGQTATVKEERLTFKTYPFSDPDPVAIVGPIYPYFRFQGYSAAGSDREWKMVSLENPYVRALVAPDIGGKVWGAVEKVRGHEFVYWNKVIKFREIAMRGPWTSGGIEFNFGIIGHAPTTATPVDYLTMTNPDGSVSCIVGAIDLPSRTYWRVNVRLPKDAAYLEAECLWFNPTPLNDSLYHWMTGAEDVADDLKYYYPGTHDIGHDGSAHPWPVDEAGRDISYYRNNDFGGSKSYHILGEYGEFFGGYFEKSGYGYGHWALHDDKPGMKLWIWSLARDGEIWTDLLSEGRTRNYTEPQTGLLFNQAGGDSGLTPFKHVDFAPESVHRWKEIWFPVTDIGGLVAASPCAALNVSRTGDKLKVGLSPLQNIDDDLVVRAAGEVVGTKHLVLKPLATFIEEFDLAGKVGEVSVELGKGKLKWSSGDEAGNRLARPIVAPADFNWSSAEGLYIAGEELARQRSYEGALAKFLACLDKEPGHVRALARTAELYAKRAEYPKALEYAKRALAIDTYDSAANFIYGVTNRELGRTADAKDGFGWAARSLEFRSAAYEQLAELSLAEKDLDRAAEYAGRALDYNRLNLSARQVEAVVSRLRGDQPAAEKALEGILAMDPLSHFARFERMLLEPGLDGERAFASLIRSELPHETYLELAMTYLGLGLEPEAVRILEMSPPHPVASLWLAYLSRDKDAARSRGFLKRAVEASPELVFPSRRETLPVLRWAAARSHDWITSYYLGLLLWHLGRADETAALWEGLGNTPEWSPFYLARARLAAEGASSDKLLADIRRAVDLDKKSWRARRALTEFYERRGDFDAALRSAKDVHDLYPGNSALAMDYAKELFHAGQPQACLKVLEGTTILPYEGASEGHDLYRQACVFCAVEAVRKGELKDAAALVDKARLWPEHLGVGRPYDTDERLENYLTALCRAKLGRPGEASKAIEEIAAETDEFWTAFGSDHAVSLLALKRLGRRDEALRLLDDWGKSRGADNSVLGWAREVFKGDAAAAQAVVEGLKAGDKGRAWDFGTGDRNFRLVLAITALAL
jgi:tetratricopeptide (TPR) repeat protein